MKKALLFALLASTVFLTSCARIYKSPDSKAIASTHQIIAIAPPQVSIFPRRAADPQVIIEQQKATSLSVQVAIYSWMMRRQAQGRNFAEIIDVHTVNDKLAEAGYFDGQYLSSKEICEILNVDGLITSRFSMSQPLSTGAAIAIGVLTDIWGPTNDIDVSMDVYDRRNSKMIWNYSRNIQGGVGSSPEWLVDNVMRHASRKMPYNL